MYDLLRYFIVNISTSCLVTNGPIPTLLFPHTIFRHRTPGTPLPCQYIELTPPQMYFDVHTLLTCLNVWCVLTDVRIEHLRLIRDT